MKKAAIHREVAEKRLPQMLPEFLCICSIVFLFSTHTLDMNYSLLSPHCNPLTLFIFANTALFLLCHSLLSQHSEKSIMSSIQHVIDHLFTSSLVILTEEHRCIRVANVSERHLDSRTLSSSISISQFSSHLWPCFQTITSVCAVS